MRKIVLSLLGLSAVSLLAACGGAPKGKCANVSCPTGQACVSSTGQCKAVVGADAGTSGGTDAGTGGGSGGGVGGGTGGGSGGGAGGGTGGGTGGGSGSACVPACGSGLTCQESSGTCVECLAAADCTDPARPVCNVTTYACEAAPAGAGEDCQVPLDVTGSMTAGTPVDFTLVGATDDIPEASCGSALAVDRVFQFTLSEVRDVTVTVTPDPASDWDATFRLVSGDCASGTERACVDGAGSGSETKFFRALLPGTWFVIVEPYDDAGLSTGTLEISAAVPPPPPGNDACAAPAVLTLSPAGTATASGDTTGATNGNDPSDGTPSCAGGAMMEGADVVYRLDVPTDTGLRLGVTPLQSGGAFAPVVYLRRGTCDDGSPGAEVGCASPSFSGPTTLVAGAVTAGTYYVWVDGADAEPGAFTLTVERFTPAANDTCAAPAQLTLSSSGTVSVAGDTSGATNGNDLADSSPSCSFMAQQDGVDVVYRLDVPMATGLRVRASPLVSGGAYSPVVYVRSACDDGTAAVELGCAEGSAGTAEVTLSNVAAGSYFIWVDGQDTGAGPFTLDVETFTPPPLVDGTGTDTCSSPPQLLAFQSVGGTNRAQVLVETGTAQDDAQGTCDFGSGGLDAVFQLNLPVSSAVPVNVTVTPPAGVDPVVYVREGNCAYGTGTSALPADLACEDGASSGLPESLQFSAQPNTDYFLYVDAYDPTGGQVLVEVSY